MIPIFGQTSAEIDFSVDTWLPKMLNVEIYAPQVREGDVIDIFFSDRTEGITFYN